MKPIPKELRAYFPAAVDDARPWWQIRGVNPGSVKWARNDGPVTYSDLRPEERGKIDRADPLPPPPILVGQVWAVLGPDNATIVVFTILSVITQPGKPLTARGTERTWFDTQLWGSGFLLTCPYGYAPWSGPEVQ